jgi:hypothetical protein
VPTDAHKIAPDRGRWLVAACILAGAALYASLAFRAAFHCDEFNVMRHTTAFSHGDFHRPGRPGLLFFLLWPTLWLPGSMATMLAARALMVAGSVATLWLAAGLARLDRPGSAVPALTVVLLLGSGSFTAHAFEIRTDVLVLPCILGAAWLLFRPSPSLRAHLIAGALIGTAGLLSQKSIYNAVAVHAGLVAYLLAARPEDLRDRFLRLAAMNALTLGMVVGYYAIMGALAGDASEFVRSNLDTATSTAFGGGYSLSRKWRWVTQNASISSTLYWLAPLGLVAAAVRARRAPAVLGVAVMGAVMASTIFVHRGFFLYYIASMEPYFALPVAAGAAAGAAALASRIGRPTLFPAALLALAVFAAMPTVRHGGRLWRVSMQPQAELLRAVDRAFPMEVRYWDGLGMFPGRVATSTFLTGTVRRKIRKQRPEAFLADWRRAPPHFFVRDYFTRHRYLKPEERRYLDHRFVYYRPNLYLYGLRLPTVAATGAGHRFEVLIGSEYTVWLPTTSGLVVRVDGVQVQHGASLRLDPGEHRVTAEPAPGSLLDPDSTIRILIGAHRREDAAPPRDHSMFPLLSRGRYQHYDDAHESGDLLTPAHDPTIGNTAQARFERHQRWRAQREEEVRRAWSQAAAPPGTSSPDLGETPP